MYNGTSEGAAEILSCSLLVDLYEQHLTAWPCWPGAVELSLAGDKL